MPFAETGCIGQAHVCGVNIKSLILDSKFEVMVGYPGGAVQQTLGNMSVRLVWKWRFRKIVEP